MALIQPLAWELLYATGATLKRKRKKEKKKKPLKKERKCGFFSNKAYITKIASRLGKPAQIYSRRRDWKGNYEDNVILP